MQITIEHAMSKITWRLPSKNIVSFPISGYMIESKYPTSSQTNTRIWEQICKTFRHSEISGYATSWAEWKKRHEDFEAFFQSVHGIVEPISCSHHEDQSHVGVSLSGKEFAELMGWKSDGQWAMRMFWMLDQDVLGTKNHPNLTSSL